MKDYWLIMRVKPWDSVQIAVSPNSFHHDICTPFELGIGFVPVFDSEEAAIEASEDGDIIRRVQQREAAGPE